MISCGSGCCALPMMRELEATVPDQKDETLLRNWLKNKMCAERTMERMRLSDDWREIASPALIPYSVLNRASRETLAILLRRSRIV